MKLSPWPHYTIEPTDTPLDICRLHPKCESVQLPGIPSDDTLRTIAKRLTRRPDIALRFYRWDTTPVNLDFLQWFPGLQKFYLDSAVTNLEPLQFLPDSLVSLRIGGDGRRLDLAPLQRFKSLRRLCIARHTKNIDVICNCKQLRDLQLSNLSLPNLTLLKSLSSLRAVNLNLGGTRSLAGLQECKSLRYLAICQIRQLDDISSVTTPPRLQYLELRALRNVTQLPAMKSMHQLRYLSLWKMRGISNLAPLASCPGLRELSLMDMGQLEPKAIAPLVDHPSLKMLSCGLGSKRKNAAAHALVPLPWKGRMTDGLKLRRRLAGHAA
jgi:hypothetical protein